MTGPGWRRRAESRAKPSECHEVGLDSARRARLQHVFTTNDEEDGAMSPKDLSANSATRRKLLGSMVSAGALLGLNAAAVPPASAAEPVADAPENLLAMARLRSNKARRSSSWDR